MLEDMGVGETVVIVDELELPVEVEDVLATLAVAKVLEESTELELDNSVVLVVDDDDGVNDVDNKDAGSTLRLDSWLEPILEVDEDITVDSDEDSNIEPDERSSELDKALVEDTFVVGSKVSSSAVLAVLDDMILEMLEDGPEGLLELILEVEDDGGKSKLEGELVKAALVLDSKVFGSTVSVVLVEVVLVPVNDVLRDGSKVEELENIELDNPGESCTAAQSIGPTVWASDNEVEGTTSGAVGEVDDDDKDIDEEVLVVLADDDCDREVGDSAVVVALDDVVVKNAEYGSKLVLESVIVIPVVELTEDVHKLEEDDSELETKLAGSTDGGLEDRDSPVEVDDEESDKLDKASIELSKLGSGEELRPEIDEEREDVKPVVGDSVDVETRLAGPIVGDKYGDVNVVTDEDVDVTDAASFELDWLIVDVAVELEDDSKTLSEVLNALSVKVLCEVGSRLSGLIVSMDEAAIVLETSEEEEATFDVELTEVAVMVLELVGEPEEVSKTSKGVDEFTSADDCGINEDDSSISVELEPCSVDGLDDVDSRLFGSTVTLEDEESVKELSDVVAVISSVRLIEVDCGKVDVGVGVNESAPLEVEELISSLVGRVVEEASVLRLTVTLEFEVMKSELSLLRVLEESAADEDAVLVMDDNGSDVAVELDADETPDELVNSNVEELVSVAVIADTIDVDIPLEEGLAEREIRVSGSSVVAVLEINDETAAEELVKVSFAESLVDMIVVAGLGVDVADGDCELLLVVDSESNEDVGLRRAESLSEITDVLLSTPGKVLLDVLVGDKVSRPIVSKELEDNRDDGGIDVGVNSVTKVLDSSPDDALADDVS
ncbi:hypothetical protein CTAM01_15635 [Colletotrichum tamarilloi]|uniref:Uncharacterized protein n=1 Tax=Colletotrichum tamarilloi TaxID=1209934 RepID=A0ABQ9QKV3_9PEZI|nr:uncharacterized protein CTAM01_15635 [Colletotrichum tamarilloi]KAK1475818.1 hypothetical protein CTAM01_15635 [Colletotrichum tamarilloi]